MFNLQPQPAAAEFIKDTTTDRFEDDVLKASLEKPVIVDFWAPWCGPCKQLMPVLEKGVAAAAGAVLMVKVNIDDNPELAQALRIQSVPTVYAFYKGQPVDGFTGAKPASEIKSFIDRLKKLSPAGAKAASGEDAAKLLTSADELFRNGDLPRALEKYMAALEADPENAAALGGMGWCLLAQKDGESLREIILNLTEEQKKNPRLSGLSVILEAGGREGADGGGGAGGLYNAALQSFAALEVEEGISSLLKLIRQDRDWQEQKARKLLLEVFDALGNGHPLTLSGRRQLSSILFS